MLAYFTALLLLAAALLLIGLRKIYSFYPARELKRKARRGDHDAACLYRAVAYGASLRLLLWILIGLLLAAGYVLLTAIAPAWLVFLAVAGLVWYGFAWSPHARISGLGGRLALMVTPALAWVLYYTHPLLDRVTGAAQQYRPVTFHTGLFEREDLVELIDSQRHLPESRIPHAELDLVLHALTFGEKAVASAMVPRQNVVTVRVGDVIGPILMDELYESKFSRFPVIDETAGTGTDSIVGTLYLHDLVSAKHGGAVGDIMKRDVVYVHADQTLYQALHAFLTTKHHLFIVIGDDEEFAGLITIEDVLEQVIGHKIEDEFDAYEDRRAVAGHGREHRASRESE